MQIKNSIDQPVTFKKGYTSKENKNNHGIGLTIINEIVDEYYGINTSKQTNV
ncbi:GHKL domain-containing protein [Catenibacterium mitsuokai]|uniref:GHKL domain-containing protein n=1 Tax=Catenibacterium mitsuokai TaxID=100886 RepID=UPI003D090C39